VAADEEDIADMVALEDLAETTPTARVRRKVKKEGAQRRRKMINNLRSVEKGAEVAADSVVEDQDAIVTIVEVVEEEVEVGGDRALTPKVKTRGREGKVSQKPNNGKEVT